LPITAVVCAKEREKSCILRDRHELPIAKGPSIWGEAIGDSHDLAEELIRSGHVAISWEDHS
jgi:hypothetical protein